ncbi:MAG: TonB-dependent receptor [Cyclobacteriaceae bacterium]
MRRLFFLLLIFISLFANAQTRVNGLIRDAHTGEILPRATLIIKDSEVNAVSDEEGRFSVQIPGDSKKVITLEARYVGYETSLTEVDLKRNTFLTIELVPSAILTEAVVVRATRAQEKIPMTFTALEKPVIRKQNFGQDMPFVLQLTPSAVSTSDAGTGIGYTGIRIRGSDATRINVTINGIPYNDSESQNVFWVDIPDIASSSQSIQIQRGIGTSGNGAGAFGATINLQTNMLQDKSYFELIQSAGSFNTLRTTVGAGTGKMKNDFSFDARYSKINSAGFIDRGTADLSSYYTSAGYYGDKTIIKAIFFGGSERTYQSWYGVPESRLKNDTEGMIETAATEGWNETQLNNLLTSNSRTFNFYTYKDQVDDYDQHHAQLHFSRRIKAGLTANASLHYTRGKGFYEEFRDKESAGDYGILTILPVPETDLVRRRWLDNHFSGTTWSVQWDKDKINSVFGGGWNFYDGVHFGEVIQSEVAQVFPQLPYRYYLNNGKKSDLSAYWKTSYALKQKLYLFGDLQYRGIRYRGNGIENEQEVIDFDNSWHFFNPKAGITWEFRPSWQTYSSIAIASREPVRNDIIDDRTGNGPKPEKLYNLEAGFRHRSSNLAFQINYYYMYYKDQLVLTGELNDVGANIRVNVPDSYRMGFEIEGDAKISRLIRWQGNLTLSRNKIRKFEEVLYDYGNDFDQFNVIRNTYRNTDISFSPEMIGSSQWNLKLFNRGELSLISKYVGSQFLDNTSGKNRMIESYFLNDLRLSWNFNFNRIKECTVSLLAANLFDVAYESNGYTYGFLGGETAYRQNFYYPQAGRNFMAMLNIRL